MTWLLQITDCHLVAPGERLLGVDTQASLEAVLERALELRSPDAILASGDLAHQPQADIYQRFLATLSSVSTAPLLCLPGNHDVLQAMQQAQLPMEPLHLGIWSVVPLDSHVDEVPEAAVAMSDEDWTCSYLQAEATRPNVLLTSHHPWVAVGAPWLDKDRIADPEAILGRLQQTHPGIRAVAFGHAHQQIDAKCAGIPVHGAPSTCFQFAPASERFSIDAAAPGYRWWHLHDDGTYNTEVARVDDFEMHIQLA
ncbi:MAG: metallophosphoesterase [Pseudomonadota bacterium]